MGVGVLVSLRESIACAGRRASDVLTLKAHPLDTLNSPE